MKTPSRLPISLHQLCSPLAFTRGCLLALSLFVQTAFAAPEIALVGNTVEIANGDSTPSASDHTFFGLQTVGAGSLSRTFSIFNVSPVVSDFLILDGVPLVSIGGANPDDFAVTAQPANLINGAASTSFQITWTPTMGGIHTATLSISNNDSNENPTTFDIQATARVTLTYEAGPNGSIVGITPQTVLSGASGSAIIAKPSPGYHFVDWDDGSTANPRVDPGGVQNLLVKAAFADDVLATVSTLAATGVTTNAVTLNASVNPNYIEATAWFEYGLTTAYGSTTVPQVLGATNAVLSVNDLVTDMSPGASYHYRVVASNSVGIIEGVDLTVDIPEVPPSVVTLPASDLMTTSARINGSVNPNNTAGAAWLEYGLTTAYGSSTATQALSAVDDVLYLSEVISGLTPGTTYHYRIVGSNHVGTAVGGDLTFTSLVVVTLPARDVLNSNATLVANVHPGGLETTVWFEWGTEANTYTQQSTPVSVGNASNLLETSEPISILPGVVYHYRAVSSNSLGVIYGGDVAFGSPVVRLNGLPDPTVVRLTPYIEEGVRIEESVVAIAQGPYHRVALRQNGTVATWDGSYYSDMSGATSNVPASVFAIPEGLDDVVAIAGGYNYSLALRDDGTVVAWGENAHGQIDVPAGLTNVVKLLANTHVGDGSGDTPFSLALSSDGTVAAWGANQYGQTNVPAGLSNVIDVALADSYCLALKGDGTVVAWGQFITVIGSGENHSYGPATVPAGLTNVVAIAAGQFSCVALQSNRTVVPWFEFAGGSFSPPPGLDDVVAVGASAAYQIGLKGDGSLVGWDFSGERPTQASVSNVVAFSTRFGTYDTGLALRDDGIVVNLAPSTGVNIPPASLDNVAAIDAGIFNNLALRRDGSVVEWGSPFGFSNSIPADIASPILWTVSGTVNPNQAGVYVLHYTATNSLGGVGTTTRTVEVIDRMPPGISNFAATIISTNSLNGLRTVELSGFIHPHGLETTLDFQYGLTLAYEGTNAAPTVFKSFTGSQRTTPVEVSAGLVWHWRIVAENDAGISISPDQILNLPTAEESLIPGDANNDGIVSQSELDAVYGHYITTSPWLAMTNVVGLGTSEVMFSLDNSVSGAYTAEVSTNLVDWVPLGPATPLYLFTDPDAPAQPQRSYRLRYP